MKIGNLNVKLISSKEWFDMITNFNKILTDYEYVVIAAFCNIFNVTISLISLNKGEMNAIQVIHPFKNNNKKNLIQFKFSKNENNFHFYIVKDNNIYFTIQKNNNLFSKYRNFLLNKTYNDMNDKEKYLVRFMCNEYNTMKQNLGSITILHKNSDKKFLGRKYFSFFDEFSQDYFE